MLLKDLVEDLQNLVKVYGDFKVEIVSINSNFEDIHIIILEEEKIIILKEIIK